ncbi:MAG: GTP pyrophosphokinase family protein [Clostridia bacterium]|nr:GTP pyrophosphokinase family protein [Clostridia bacterium]
MQETSIIKVEEKIDKKANDFERIMLIYKSAIKVLKTKFDILNEEFDNFCEYNPIDHITERIKSPDSIIEKMNRKELELTYQNLVEQINDIAGMRIVCSFKDDIFKIVDIIENFQDIEIIERKDYVTNPKPSGYSSYHMVVKVPVNFTDKTIYVKVELQIRTVAMDFWASLEHKLKYKKEISKKASKELVNAAKTIAKLDDKMMQIKFNV